MSTYRQAPDDVISCCHQILKRTYPELHKADVTIELLFAHAPRNEQDEPQGPALKLHGWPAAATVKVNSLKDRVAGCKDVRILIDGDRWPDWEEARKKAILDHELYHLELRKDEEGAILLDDAFRPKLRLKPHDFEVKGFDAIIDRHGHAALEAEAAIDLQRRLTQRAFSWG